MSIERLLKKPIDVHEIKKILAFAENGFDDLINSRKKKFQALEIDEKKIVIGFNEREIRCFLSKEYRRTQLLDSGGYYLEE